MADFLGVSDIHYWKVEQDDKTAYTAGTIKVLSSTAELTQTTEQSQATTFYSNHAKYAVNAVGSTTLSAVVEALSLEVLADIQGVEIDSATGALIDDGEAKNLAFGISFRADFVGDIGARYYSFPKVIISMPDEATKTKDEGTDTLNQTLTITATSTVHEFTKTGKACKSIKEDTIGNTKIDFTKWFEQPITPDTLASITTA